MSEPIRLSKRVMALVPCSRSEAEQFIDAGRVRVDGIVVDQPQHRVGDGQRVEVDATATPDRPQPASFLLHKPSGMPEHDALALLVPANRVPDDASGIRPLKRHLDRLESLLPLPQPASGLAVFSQDCRVVRKLNEDARTIEQELIAEVSGAIAPNGLARLCHGLVFEREPLPPARVSWQSETRLRFAVKGIAPWVVPWMCGQVGLQLQALRRIRIGRVPLAGLAPGQWRYLYPGEKF